MTARENDELQQAKTFVLNWQQSIDSATEDGIRDLRMSRGLGDVYKRQKQSFDKFNFTPAV